MEIKFFRVTSSWICDLDNDLCLPRNCPTPLNTKLIINNDLTDERALTYLFRFEVDYYPACKDHLSAQLLDNIVENKSSSMIYVIITRISNNPFEIDLTICPWNMLHISGTTNFRRVLFPGISVPGSMIPGVVLTPPSNFQTTTFSISQTVGLHIWFE